ncbi:MAG: ABC transporter ATP-binding protein [Gemmatimonadetes bacterium]|nr:ABC transporter ATP-binding protein [Gemmatimonadota bacterium]
MDGALLTAQSVGKSFWQTEVLKAATLWCDAGCITALMGRNGSGKSTLLKIAAGRLRADYGVVHFAGEVFERPRARALVRRGLFYLADRGLLSNVGTVRDHLEVMCRCFGTGGLEETAENLGISHVLDVRTHKISGGERRRAELVMMLLRKPTCVLADEPMAGLTPSDRVVVAEALRTLARAGAGIVVTGHDVPDLFEVADHVTWMTAGTTHQIGTPTEARRHDQFVREYLGPGGALGASVPEHNLHGVSEGE